MKASYKIERSQVEDMEMTISLTMTVKEWLEIMRTKSESPHWGKLSRVQNMISAALGDVTNATEKNYSVDEFMVKKTEG